MNVQKLTIKILGVLFFILAISTITLAQETVKILGYDFENAAVGAKYASPSFVDNSLISGSGFTVVQGAQANASNAEVKLITTNQMWFSHQSSSYDPEDYNSFQFSIKPGPNPVAITSISYDITHNYYLQQYPSWYGEMDFKLEVRTADGTLVKSHVSEKTTHWNKLTVNVDTEGLMFDQKLFIKIRANTQLTHQVSWWTAQFMIDNVEVSTTVNPNTAPTFTQLELSSDSQILNDGLLISANNYGAGAGSAKVNGVCFEPSTLGLSNFGNGGGDFYANPVSPDLDAVLSGLVYQPNGSPSSVTIGGLTPGNRHRLQLLFSNDVNVTGNNVFITVEGVQYHLSSWIPSSVNLVVEFTASSTEVVAAFGGNNGREPNRAVLNAYAIHDLDQASVPCGNTAPVAYAGEDQLIECSPSRGAEVTLNGSGTDADNDQLTYSWYEGAKFLSNDASFSVLFTPRTHILTLTVDDGNGGSSSDEVIIKINSDNDAPVPDAESLADVVGECSAAVTVVPTATDACEGTIAGSTSDPLEYTAQGTYTITWTFTDANGNSSEQTQLVVVKDVTAPTISSDAQLITLWSPNHKYETVSLSDFGVSISDNCADVSSSALLITKVTSDEAEDSKGNGDGNTRDDIIIADDFKSVDLRKERDGKGNGRVYTIYASISDGNGNISDVELFVQVPHDKNDNAVKDDDQYSVVGGIVEAGGVLAEVSENGADISTIKSITENKSSANNAAEALPEGYELSQNYPNPFNPSTTISFAIPEAGYYSLRVFNTLGQVVAELANGQIQSGYYNYSFDASKLTSGMYIYSLQGNNVNISKKMILMK